MALGSISFSQRPQNSTYDTPVLTNWTPIVPYTVKQTNITGLFYFKFVLEIRIDDASGLLIAKIKQRPNGYTTGTINVYTTFDVRDIVNTFIQKTYEDQNESGEPIHTLAANGTDTYIYSGNSYQIRNIYVKAYQSYSTVENAFPTEDNSENTTTTLKFIAASLPLTAERGVSGNMTYFQGTTFKDIYSNLTSTGYLLSDVRPGYYDVVPPTAGFTADEKELINKVQVGDYHTVGFLNSYYDLAANVGTFLVRFYNASGTQLTQTYITNDSTTGGEAPLQSGIDTDKNIIYFGCGPANLEAYNNGGTNTQRPSSGANIGWAYYIIEAKSASLTYQVARRYWFVRQEKACKGYITRRLGWINSLGCWDYFNFKMKSVQSIEVKRNTYGQAIGDFNSLQYSYYNYESQNKVLRTTATKKETLNTDFITEADTILLEKLMMSTDVFVIENGDTEETVPVRVVDTNIIRKTRANNKANIQYTITIEYSNPINTNS